MATHLYTRMTVDLTKVDVSSMSSTRFYGLPAVSTRRPRPFPGEVGSDRIPLGSGNKTAEVLIPMQVEPALARVGGSVQHTEQLGKRRKGAVLTSGSESPGTSAVTVRNPAKFSLLGGSFMVATVDRGGVLRRT